MAAIHASKDDFTPLGAGVVIDVDRVLTSRHVVERIAPGALWVGFPMTRPFIVERVREDHRVLPTVAADIADVVVVYLVGEVPGDVRPARLRVPAPGDIASRRWWAFGFPGGDPRGGAAEGQIGEGLGYGWMRLHTAAGYAVKKGFSGAGVWCEDYQSVVAVIGQADQRGDAQALSLEAIDAYLAEEKLAVSAGWSVHDAGETALEQWGWRLTEDLEAARHWHPRSRGVAVESERGYRFRGRRVALTEIVRWLDRSVPDRRVLVVTGSPGVGKSAVLGRVVTTADASFRGLLPPTDSAVRATVGSVACAVHAKAKTALEVATEIASAASATLSDRVVDAVPALAAVLRRRGGHRFNVIIDALDETATPGDAREVIRHLVVPLVESCADVGLQVVVGTRRLDDDGSLLDVFGRSARVIDLDEPGNFDLADLISYAQACLCLEGSERPNSPYADATVAEPLAAVIAERSARNFLVAGLIARRHGLYDEQPTDPGQIDVAPNLRDALADYTRRLPLTADLGADQVLTALAYAESPGFTLGLWAAAIGALFGTVPTEQSLDRFAHSSAANFLLEQTAPDGVTTFRLYHQALNDTLLAQRQQRIAEHADEAALTRAFMARGGLANWKDPEPYLLRSLPGHARRGRVTDELLADQDYLLSADLLRLIPTARSATTRAGKQRCRLLRYTTTAVHARPPERAAAFSVSNALDQLGLDRQLPVHRDAPYTARWARAQPRTELFTLTGHPHWVNAVCEIRTPGRVLLASAGNDAMVRLWDPATGQPFGQPLTGHTDPVRVLCAIEVEGRELVASGGDDMTVRLWDPTTSKPYGERLPGHTGPVRAMCTMDLEGRVLLASGGDDGTVRLWDPTSGELHGELVTGQVNALVRIEIGSRVLLASGGDDATVQLWDPVAGRSYGRPLTGHSDSVRALCAVEAAGSTILASGGSDLTVWLWDPVDCEALDGPLTGHAGWVNSLCSIDVDGRTLLGSASTDETVRLWNPATRKPHGQPVSGHTGPVNGVCSVEVDGRVLLASASTDQTVRLWDLAALEPRGHLMASDPGWVSAVCTVPSASGTLVASAGPDQMVRLWVAATGLPHGNELTGHTGPVNALCRLDIDGQPFVASASSDLTVRFWDPATSRSRGEPLVGHTDSVRALCAVEVDGRILVASGGDDGTVRLSDAATGRPHCQPFTHHTDSVRALCTVEVDGRVLVASGGDDGTVWLWDPATGHADPRPIAAHADSIAALCSVDVDGQVLLASASDDQTVRLWNPASGRPFGDPLVGHSDWIFALCSVDVEGRTLLASASDDRTVQVWDPATGQLKISIPVHHPALAITAVGQSITIGLTVGLLMIDLPPGLGRDDV